MRRERGASLVRGSDEAERPFSLSLEIFRRGTYCRPVMKDIRQVRGSREKQEGKEKERKGSKRKEREKGKNLANSKMASSNRP